MIHLVKRFKTHFDLKDPSQTFIQNHEHRFKIQTKTYIMIRKTDTFLTLLKI